MGPHEGRKSSEEIRQVGPEEQARFLELAQALFPDERIAIHEQDEIFMAYQQERPVAFLHLRPRAGATYLQGIGVLQAHRQEGWGRALMQLAIKRTMARFPSRGLALKVKPANLEAVRLYLSAGFTLERYSEQEWGLRWKPLN